MTEQLEGCDDLNETTPMGHAMRKYFQFDPDYICVNHGSYGSTPKCIAAKANEIRRHVASNPDHFNRFDFEVQIRRARQAVAEYINADAQDVVFVANASAGMNSVLRSLRYKQGTESAPGDKILSFDCAYGMTKCTLKFLADNYAVENHVVNVKWPVKHQELIEQVKDAIQTHGPFKLATFAHITSQPACILPVRELIDVCRQHDVLTLVDGAHAVGQIKLDMNSLAPDFYTSNLHKWCYAPSGCAFLYVKQELQALIHPPVISFGYGDFQNEFLYLGTLDNANYLSVPACLQFRARIGEQRLLSYIHDLAVKIGKTVARIWGTEVLNADEAKLGAMVDVRCPTDDQQIISFLRLHLLLAYKTYVPFYTLDGRCFARFSAQIFNELSDYEKLAHEILYRIQRDGPQTPYSSSTPILLPDRIAGTLRDNEKTPQG